MRVTKRGQITIPKELRDALDIGPGDEVEVGRAGELIFIRKSATEPPCGGDLVERLRGRGDLTMTTDEIMVLTREF